ncbi:MAG TPA: hypothetical protein VF601_18970 [Beijerinckiaceae bacterium]|jgi:hypothetical protein
MPHFHFDIVEDGGTLPDDEGIDLSSAEAARLEAARAAAEIMRERAWRQAIPADVSIVIRDDIGPISTVTVALRLS